MPPSTVPSVDTSSGSPSRSLSASLGPPLSLGEVRPLLKTTPSSLTRISHDSRACDMVGALIVLSSWATMKRLLNTENCWIRSRT